MIHAVAAALLALLVAPSGATDVAAVRAHAPVADDPPTAVRPAPARLPERWHGAWSGELVIVGRDEPVAMRLEIAPIDEDASAVTWRMVYGTPGEPGASVRDYALRAGDAPGAYVLDERNGILIDTVLRGDVLASAFAVGDVLLLTRTELRARRDRPELHFEITTFDRTAPRRTAFRGDDDAPDAAPAADAPVVESFRESGRQRAILRRERR